MFQDLVPIMRMKANPHPELRGLIPAELPGGGEYVKINRCHFFSATPPKLYVSASYLKNKK